MYLSLHLILNEKNNEYLAVSTKNYFQHSREEWQSLQSVAPVLIATCLSQIDNILDHMGAGFYFLFYENFNDNPFVEMDIYHYAQTIKQRVSFTSPKSMF